MAITSADGWFAAAKQKVYWAKTTAVTTTAGNPFSMWGAAGNPGAGTLAVGNTTTGVLFDDTTAGSPSVNSFGGSATGYLAAGRYRNSVPASLILYDRLWGAGPISATLTAGTVTSFSGQPSIAGRLPGGTDYGNLDILIEVTTNTTGGTGALSVGYTNQAGTTGRTTGAVTIGAVNTPRVLILPLQAGDQGVQKIESLTVTTANTAGAYNVILARRLAVFDVRVANAMDSQAWDMIGGPVVFDTSCLWGVVSADSTSSGVTSLDLDIING
jgi:hypothetical protein